MRVVPMLSGLYLTAYLDRTNIANAKLLGLETELKIPCNGYNTAVWVFFLMFVLMEVPSNLFMTYSKIPHGQCFGFGGKFSHALLLTIRADMLSSRRDYFMIYATEERVCEGLNDGTFVKETDVAGLQWGGLGRVWRWMAIDVNRVKELGLPGYSDI